MENPINKIEKLAKEENQQLEKESNLYQEKLSKSIESDTGIHSTPVLPKEPKELERQKQIEELELQIRNQMPPAMPDDTGIEMPASIHQETNGRTILSDLFELKDNYQTFIIDKYILQKMKVGKLEDNTENYKKVLSRLMAKNRVSFNQQKPYVLKKLYLYLTGRKTDEEDDLVISILNQKGVKI